MKPDSAVIYKSLHSKKKKNVLNTEQYMPQSPGTMSVANSSCLMPHHSVNPPKA